MKKIAFYVESMILGGAEKVLLDIVNHLDPSIFDITIISIYKKSVYPSVDTYDFESKVNNNVRIITLIDNSHRLSSDIYNHLYARVNKSAIYKALVREKYDIEVAFYEGLPTEFVANSTNKKSIKYAWLHTNNDRLYENKSSQYIDRIYNIYKKYDCVIGVSDNTRESFLRYFPDIPNMTIYNGVNLSEIRNKSKENCDLNKTGKISFITVGRIVPVKGYDRLLEACKRLVQDGYQFTLFIIGDGSDKRILENYIHENDLNDSVFLLGEQKNPYKFFTLCNAYVCSSLTEGFGLAIVEAMSCGLPVLTTDFSGIREIVGKSNNTWNICENSTEGLYTVLKEALNNPKKIESLISVSLTQSKRFDISNQIQAIQNLFLNGVSL